MHDFYMMEDAEFVCLEYKPKLLLFYPKHGLCILENETNKKQVKYTIIRRGLRRIFDFDPKYLRHDEEYTRKTQTIQKLMIGPIFVELEKARRLKCHSKSNRIKSTI
jgi:hypothetical protein